MNVLRVLPVLTFAVFCASVADAAAAPILVAGPSPIAPFGGTVLNFEGFAEGEIIDNEFAALGVTFTQTGGGAPKIDNLPALAGYGTGSGTGMLTGSSLTGAVGTIAGIIATFTTGQSQVGAFMSDTSPLADYTITVYGAGGVVLESFVVSAASFPGSAICGSSFPAAPGCGVFVGFDRPTGDIVAVQFGPSTTFGDSFSIDDLRFAATAPEPASLLLFGAALLGAGLRRRQNRA